MEDTKYSRERPKGSLAPQTTFTDELKGRENYQQKFKKRQPTSRRGKRKEIRRWDELIIAWTSLKAKFGNRVLSTSGFLFCFSFEMADCVAQRKKERDTPKREKQSKQQHRIATRWGRRYTDVRRGGGIERTPQNSLPVPRVYILYSVVAPGRSLPCGYVFNTYGPLGHSSFVMGGNPHHPPPLLWWKKRRKQKILPLDPYHWLVIETGQSVQ